MNAARTVKQEAAGPLYKAMDWYELNDARRLRWSYWPRAREPCTLISRRNSPTRK